MNKICLITHGADADGAFPIILSKLVFDKFDAFSCEISEVNEKLKEILNNHDIYEKIYITDLNINEEIAKYINEDDVLKNKIKIFDHHESNLFLNKYSFINVVVDNNNRKECGTTLYLDFLKQNYYNPILDKNSLNHMVELVRQVDTYDFSDELKDDAFSFGELYAIYGRINYIEKCYKFILENDDYILSDTDKLLINLENERKNRYIEEKLKHVKKAKINGIPVGIVFAEQYRSSLGHEIANKMKDIDIAVIINVDRSLSYRADKDEVDINILASMVGGGGHKHAGGSPLPNDLQEKITEYIFNNIEWEKK